MTAYLVTGNTTRSTITATWTGRFSDVGRPITTVVNSEQAHGIAWGLTQLSENAWEAAAWLDTTAAIEFVITRLINQLRDAAVTDFPLPAFDFTDFRHHDADGTWGVQAALNDGLVGEFDRLSRAQRLSIAEELAADQTERRLTIERLDLGQEPEDDGRGWEIATVSRSLRLGQGTYLPDAANTWVAHWYGTNLMVTDRWKAAAAVRRIDQLVDACHTHGGRGGCDWDCGEAHLVMPRTDTPMDDDIWYVSTPSSKGRYGRRQLTTMMEIRKEGEVVAEVDARDDNGFTRVLGQWAAPAAEPATRTDLVHP